MWFQLGSGLKVHICIHFCSELEFKISIWWGDLRKQSVCSERLSGVFCLLTSCLLSALAPHFSPLPPRFLPCNPVILVSHQPLLRHFFLLAFPFFFFSLQPLDVGTPRSPCWALLSLTPRDLILSPRLSSALISTNTIYQQRTCLLYFWLWPLWTPDTSIPTIVAQNRRDLEFKYPRQNSWYISCISHLVLP